MRILALLAACAALPAHADVRLTLPFAAEVAGQPLACAARHAGIGTTGSTVRVADFRLFVSNVRLVAADGTEVPVALDQDGTWQVGTAALLDFEDATGACLNGTPETNKTLRGTVPDGTYRGLRFDIGLPFAVNHGDPTLAPSPLNLTAMFWTWQGGYKFVKIDLDTEGQPLTAAAAGEGHATPPKDGPKGWSLHLGSTGCASESRTSPPVAECANPNRIAVRLDGFRPGTDMVVIDPAPVLAAADVDANAPGTAAGCMSFPKDADCLTVMERLGLPYMDRPAGTQVLVRLR